MTTRVTGIPEWKEKLRVLMARVDRVTEQTTTDGALLVEAEVKLTLRLSAHPRGTATPARVGGPPSWVSGFLSRTVEHRAARRIGPYRYSAEVGPTAKYARIQELGGMSGRHHRTHTPYRPYMLPATVRSRERVRNLYRRRWAETINHG